MNEEHYIVSLNELLTKPIPFDVLTECYFGLGSISNTTTTSATVITTNQQLEFNQQRQLQQPQPQKQLQRLRDDILQFTSLFHLLENIGCNRTTQLKRILSLFRFCPTFTSYLSPILLTSIIPYLSVDCHIDCNYISTTFNFHSSQVIVDSSLIIRMLLGIRCFLMRKEFNNIDNLLEDSLSQSFNFNL